MKAKYCTATQQLETAVATFCLKEVCRVEVILPFGYACSCQAYRRAGTSIDVKAGAEGVLTFVHSF